MSKMFTIVYGLIKHITLACRGVDTTSQIIMERLQLLIYFSTAWYTYIYYIYIYAQNDNVTHTALSY